MTSYSLGTWIAATRPRTLAAAVVPVLVGLALAARDGALDAPVAVVTLLTASLIQIATNLANDYFDAVKGADGPDRLGPTRLSQGDPEAAQVVLRATVVVLVVAAALGLFLVARGGWPIAAIGVASLVSAMAYTAGPWPLAYLGLGDVFVFVFFGPVAVAGTYFLQRSTVSPETFVASIPVGCLATAILVVNNLRDLDGDARVGKRTLAVRLGAPAMRIGYVALLIVAFAVATGTGAWPVLLAAPLAVMEARALTQRDGRALNASLAGTARLHLVFGLLLALALLR